MTQKVAKKIGFWTALAMLAGSIVGVGIFFKNGSIFAATGGNGTATLLAWIIGGLISLFAAISFSEIGSQKFKNVHGLAAWSESALGKKFGYFTRFNLSFFYYGILSVIFGVFVSESFFNIIEQNSNLKTEVWVHIVVGVAIDAFFLTLNFLSIVAGSWISRFSTVLKLVPLTLVAIAGIVLANTNNDPSATGLAGHNAFTNGRSFSFTGLLAALPAVLFAYDAFLDAGTYADKVKGGSKTISKAIVVTLISVLVLYSIISVAHILHGAGSVTSLFTQVFPASANKGLTTFVWVFLFFSACGVMNGVTAAGVSSTEQTTRTFTSFGSKKLVSKFGLKKAAGINQAVISIFWGLIVFIPALVFKSDAFVDAISNFPTVFFFAIYGLTILGYWIKRDKLNSKKINNILFYVSSALAIAGIAFVIVYQLTYGFTVQSLLHPHDFSSAGFLHDGGGIQLIQFFGIFIGALVIFFALPIINWALTKKVENNNVIVDTETLKLGNEELI